MLSGRPKSPMALPLRAPSALFIDEILEQIFSLLDQRTLKFVAARVSSRWFWIARDLFEHHLVLNHSDLPRILDAALNQKLTLANKLTVGRTIGPWHDLHFEPEAAKWDRMMGLLVQTLSKARSESGDQRHFTKIRALVLNVEHWWIRPEQVLDWLDARSLKELSIDVPYETGPLPLGRMLDQCPSLLHLSLSTRKWSRTSRVFDESQRTWISENAGHQASTRTETWPLRSLRLRDITISPTALQSYLPHLEELTEIYLLEVKDPEEGDDTFHSDAATAAFWHSLAKHCQKVETIHFGCQVYETRYSAIPFDLFPKVYNFGIQGSANCSLPVWKALTIHRVENRLTTLELLGDRRYRSSDRVNLGHVRDSHLHLFLCHSPSLLHLKTGQLQISSSILWGDENDHVCNEKGTIGASNIWACRSLVTLWLRLESLQPSESGNTWSASVFGYLSRVCPNIERLSLGVGLQGWALQSGLCLLTRMRLLRRLELIREGIFNPEWIPLQRQDFAWIQGNANATRPQISSLKPLTMVTKLVPSILRPYIFRPHGSLKDVLDDYRHCITAVLTSKDVLDSPSFKQDQERMHQQQKENRFVSDYERPMPMVDGLLDFEFSGPNLDIEAYLQARLFCLQEQQEGDVWLPWPHMEQIVFIHEYPLNGSYRKLEEHLTRGCKLLRSFRPDIDLSCHFGMVGTYSH